MPPCDRGAGLVVGHLLRQIGRDDLDLLALLAGELGAAALVVELDQFLALLDHLLQQRRAASASVSGALALPARLDIGVLDGGIDQPQRRDAALVLRLSSHPSGRC